jgi:hypothetical protein
LIPFLKRNKEASMSAPVEAIERKPDEDKDETEFDGLESAMEELHTALNSKDYKLAAEIFRSAFELMESQPHTEGPHTDGN